MRIGVLCSIGAAVLAVVAAPRLSRAQAVVTLDPTADVHPISPLIYGVNYASTAQVAAGVTATRWGGNSTSRYNYLIDVSNTGFDYYFENVAGCWNAPGGWCATPPTNPKETSGANAFLQAAKTADITALFTIPTLGWVAKAAKYAHPFDCGCPRTSVPTQDSFDPYDTNCGNGQSGGAWVTCPAPTTTSSAVDPMFMRDWATYLVGRFGPSGGKRIYALDNEPALWSSTHHDVHPARLTYDELWQRMRDYAVALTTADPTAPISGPAEWGWPNYFCSDADNVSSGCSATSPDRAAHGGKELMAWLLEQAAAYEKSSGKRILHYLDLHYYPQGGTPPQITRSLWDASYTDPSWIGDKIRLIPRMRAWVNTYYPGTKIAISEYDFYHHDETVGAITYAEVLGIFGREGVDLATAWSPPATTERAFGAFKLYRNYDGAGAKFESTSVRATVTGTGVEAYAAIGTTKMTVVVVNENSSAETVDVKIGSFAATGAVRLFTGNSTTITRQADPTLTAGTTRVSVPATSFALVEITGTPPTTTDAGVDGGASDAAADTTTTETGATDGGTDTNATDGGTDTGATDTGTDTGEVVDSGTTADSAMIDGATVADATTDDASQGGNAATSDDAGCGCGVPGERPARAGLFAAALLLSVTLAGRRARRRAPAQRRTR